MNQEEFIAELNKHVEDINKVFRGAVDEETGFYKRGNLLSKFMFNINSLDIFSSFIDIKSHIDCCMCEPITKKIIIRKTMDSIHDIQNLLEDGMGELEIMLKELNNGTTT